MFILEVGNIGGVGGGTGPKPNIKQEPTKKEIPPAKQDTDSFLPGTKNYADTLRITPEGKIVPFTLQEGVSMVATGIKQLEYYKPINNMLGSLLEVVDALNIGGEEGKKIARTKSMELKDAWNNINDLAKGGNPAPLELLKKAGISEKVVNNPEKLEKTEVEKLKVLHSFTKGFQADWQNMHDTGVKVLKREKEFAKLLKGFSDLARP